MYSVDHNDIFDHMYCTDLHPLSNITRPCAAKIYLRRGVIHYDFLKPHYISYKLMHVTSL